MAINNKVVSFDKARQLYDVGLRIETERVYVNGSLMYKSEVSKKFDRGHDIKSYCAAPDFIELNNILPERIDINGFDFYKTTLYELRTLCYFHTGTENIMMYQTIIPQNREVTAAADMVLKGIEEGWISL